MISTLQYFILKIKLTKEKPDISSAIIRTTTFNGLFKRNDNSPIQTRLGELNDLRLKIKELRYNDVLGFAVVYPFIYPESEVKSLDENVVLLSRNGESENLLQLLTNDDIKLLEKLKCS